MRIFLLLPIVMAYILFVLFLAGWLVCCLYSRYAKRKLKLSNAGSKSMLTNPSDFSLENHTNKESIQKKRKAIRSLSKCINPYIYGLCRYYSILIGRFPSQRVRNFLMRKCFCMDISPKTVLYGGFEMRSPWNIHVGEAVIGVGALLDGRKGIYIADRVCLAQNVKIFTLQHDVNDSNFIAVGEGVILEEYSWISSGTTVLPGVTVGKGAVLASGAIATKNLEPYGVYAGIPAKKISERNHNLNYETCREYWHFY